MNSDKILIVDDSPENIQLLFAMLQDDYNIIFSNSGEKALKLAQEDQPDLILLDIVMPKMDGYEVIKKLKNNATTQAIPIVFLTAKTSKEDLIKGFSLGCVDYIIKPFLEEEIKVRLATHLQNRSLITQLESINENLKRMDDIKSDFLSSVPAFVEGVSIPSKSYYSF